ncbi:hypothetical protein MGYG_02205 [Nannizzia gypsea CBS 118893]|uniref:Uncharacterized protein n=1 Tax=Arthroderma gypseum (strain ATCC MYA-4604 / CBS 118893) TaxID=535722 RepID=E4UQB0_ARTGP|nr:hypothetical protein MGYG_02205 [Nannizzia gypsea CBS 118893]EFQ99191.1 hypothetical protein MGYG_02205 [Nannizzia gypsea CBS 118893]
MQFFTTLLLLVPFVLAAPGDDLGTRHSDFRCTAASTLHLIEGECTTASGALSINFLKDTDCDLHATTDCSDTPDYRLLQQGCRNFMPGDEKYKAIRCAAKA